MKSRSYRNSHDPRRYTWYSIFLLLGGVSIVLFGYFFFSIKNIGSYVLREDTYTITKGMNLTTLDTALDWDVSHTKYKLWVRFFAPEVSLKAGKYSASGMTIEGFLRDGISKPVHSDNTIMILPWWNLYDIDAYLTRENVTESGAFLSAASNIDSWRQKYDFLDWVASLEGFLIPDTYRIRQDADAESIVSTLLSAFDTKIASSYRTLGPKAYDTLILASIVEREEKNNANKSMVAGILTKRLDEGIPLWADATVCYSYSLPQSLCSPRFISEHINEDTPYNTRSTKGLPPTPISSISLSTWNATLNPTPSDYYFYLHDSEWGIHYATTNEEHVRNKNIYLK